jgi:hypothetical protein
VEEVCIKEVGSQLSEPKELTNGSMFDLADALTSQIHDEPNLFKSEPPSIGHIESAAFRPIRSVLYSEMVEARHPRAWSPGVEAPSEAIPTYERAV